MRQTIHANNLHPTVWSAGFGSFVCLGKIRINPESGMKSSQPGMADKLQIKEEGR